ncbi:MAG: NEW3 domain-containing protein [Acidobacteriota bacterium]|jgi:hypothetical protein
MHPTRSRRLAASILAVLLTAPWLIPLLTGLAAAPATAQIQNLFNPRDDEYRLLGLIRAKAEYEQALAAYESLQTEHENGIVSENEVREARVRMESARVDYLQQSLAVIFEQPHVLIERAVKYQGPDGEKFVRLTLRNTAGSSVESERLADLIDEEILGQLEPDRLRSVFVSLKDEPGLGGAIISSPYEKRIDELRFGEPVTVSFRLLRDRDTVTVSVTYASRLDEKVVYLEKDATANVVSIQSTQFSQEADLGSRADYDLALEQFTDEANTFRLAAVGLPPDIRHEFRDPDSGARLTQVRFPVGVSQRDLSLSLALPQRAGGSLPVSALDRPLTFWALVLNERDAGRLDAWLAEQDGEQAGIGRAEVASFLEGLDAGKTRLEIIPRGVGRVEMRAPNLYHEIAPGEDVTMEVTLENSGSRGLETLRLVAETQLGWRGRVEPDLIPSLPVDGERRVRVTFTPPEDVAVGDYQMRLRAESAAGDRRVESQESTVRIHVDAPANLALTGGLALLLIALVAGIVIFGVRMTRR